MFGWLSGKTKSRSIRVFTSPHALAQRAEKLGHDTFGIMLSSVVNERIRRCRIGKITLKAK